MKKKLLDFDINKVNLEQNVSSKLAYEVSKKDIAIIGMSARFPNARNVEEFWNNIKMGLDCITPFPEGRRRDTEHYLKLAGSGLNNIQYGKGAYLDDIDKFDCNFFRISPREANLMDPNQRLFMQVVWEAIEDAGYGGDCLNGSNTGVYVGFGGETPYRRYIAEAEPLLQDMALAGNLDTMIAGRIPYILDMRGPGILVNTACSSSLSAVYLACQEIRYGSCDMIIVGSVNISFLPVERTQKLGIESSDGKTRSFDDSSDGTGVGEGVAAVILKSLSSALRDGDNIHAVIKGTAINQDGSSNGITAPNPAAQEDVIIKAWTDARVDPETITYIEAHGTGTRLGDPIEIEGISRAFHRYTAKKQFCAIGSVKSNMGHLNYAAGMAGLIKAIMALKHREIPPTINFNRPNREIDFKKSPVYINDTICKWESVDMPRRCGVSSFGLSGTNCHIVLEEVSSFINEDKFDDIGPFIFTLSAKSTGSFIELVKRYQRIACSENGLCIRDICYTANTGRGHYNHRLAMVIWDMGDFREKINKLYEMGSFEKLEQLATEGIYCRKHEIISEMKEKESEENIAEMDITENEKCKLEDELKRRIREFVNSGNNNSELLYRICELYVKGADIDWDMFYSSRKGKKVSLPVYPFERRRCWLEVPGAAMHKKTADEGGLYHAMRWKRKDVDIGKVAGNAGIEGSIVLFDNGRGKCKDLAVELRKSGKRVIIVETGESFNRENRDAYIIGNSQEDYTRLLEVLSGEKLSCIIHMKTLGYDRMAENAVELEERLDKGIFSLLRIVKAAAVSGMQEELDTILISEYGEEVTGNEGRLNPENAVLYGLGKAAGYESPVLRTRCIDTDEGTGMECIADEIVSGCGEYKVAYREGHRYVEELEEVDLSKRKLEKVEIKRDGVYIITGGTGGLGLETGRHFASKERVRLALVSRTGMPVRENWDGILVNGDDEALCKKIKSILDIEVNGTEVRCFNADISDEMEIAGVIKDIKNRYGRIDGVVHCAGIGTGKGGENLIDLSEERLKEEIAPKIKGTWLLERMTREEKLDFFVAYSSPITIMSGVGAGGYTAANSYLDPFVLQMRKSGRKALSIGWAPWEVTVRKMGGRFRQDRQMFRILTTEKLMECLEEAMVRDIGVVNAGNINYESDMFQVEDKLPFRMSENMRRRVEKSRGAYDGDRASTGRQAAEVMLKGRKDGAYTGTEKQVAQVFGSIMGFDGMDVYDNFFELGGDSIIAMKAVNELNRRTGLDIKVTDLLRHPTVREFSEHLDVKYPEKEKSLENECAGRTKGKYKFIGMADEREYYPVSSAQKRLFVLNKMDPSSMAYNVSQVMEIQGALDRQRVRDAFSELVKRHEGLRTSFHMENGIPVQVVHPHPDFDIACMESDENNIETYVRSFFRPFDLGKAPLLKAALIRLNENKHMLLFDIHHIISDAVTIGIIIREFISFYEGREKDLPELEICYKDFSVWQNGYFKSEELKNQEKYWLDTFKGELPVLDLPADFTRPPVKSYEGDILAFRLGRELTLCLKKLAGKTDTTPFMLLLATYNILLAKYAGQEDIIVGTPIAGRNHPQVSDIIGIFINTLVMRNYPSSGKSFREFLNEVKINALKAYENQDYPFEELVEKLNLQRDLSREPLFDTMFNYQNADNTEVHMEHLEVGFRDPGRRTSKFDISMEAIERGGDIEFVLEYNTRLFKKETIERFGNHFINKLVCIIKNPDIHLDKIDMLTKEEKDQVHNVFNNTRTIYRKHTTINGMFEKQAETAPERIALQFDTQLITYEELNRQANSLAEILRDYGIKPGRVAAIIADRSPYMIVGILAVLKAGGAYLPIDPFYPDDRINYMLDDSRSCVILTQTKLMRESIGISLPKIDIENMFLYREDAVNLKEMHKPGDLAYVIYTSGSTGNPKGVMIEHRQVVNFIEGVTERINFSSDRSILALTTICFDIFVLETLLPLTKGMKVVIADRERQRDSKLLGELIKNSKVDMIQMTPSRMQMLLKSGADLSCLEGLKVIMLGGEALSQALLDELKIRTKARIYNMYGPTETTVWSSIADLTDEDTVHIGRPIANTQIYVLDSCNNIQPVGVKGELCIAGDGLARGYINNPSLTEDKFIPNPFTEGERFYKTGDLARRLPDGSIECLGRMDSQVKVMGYRIELKEIENCIRKFKPVRDCVVAAKDDSQGMKRLVAYYLSDGEINVSELRNHISKSLPEYMVPGIYQYIEQFPMTQNGKIDKKSLPDPGNERPDLTAGYKAAETTVENSLVDIWEQVLDRRNIGVDDNFFDLGGTSLTLVYMHSILDRQYPEKVNVADIFANPTISRLARYIENAGKKVDSSLKPETLELPFEYFIDGNEANDHSLLKINISPSTYEMLSKLTSINGFQFQDILLALYAYLLSEISERHEICTHVLTETKGVISPFKIDMSNISDYISLFREAEKWRRQDEHAIVHISDNMSSRIIQNEAHSILPFFSYISSGDVSIGSISGLFGLSLEIRHEAGNLNLIWKFETERLKYTKVNEIAYLYMKLMDAVLNQLLS